MVTIAIISDSHNLVRPELEDFLKSADLVIHAGDVGSDQTLQHFQSLNENTILVRGNTDLDIKVSQLPEHITIEVENHSIHVVHDIIIFSQEPIAPDFVIYGHSHKPVEERKGDTLYVNPGSIGPRRFSLPISYASLELDGNRVSLKFHTIDP